MEAVGQCQGDLGCPIFHLHLAFSLGGLGCPGSFLFSFLGCSMVALFFLQEILKVAPTLGGFA